MLKPKMIVYLKYYEFEQIKRLSIFVSLLKKDELKMNKIIRKNVDDSCVGDFLYIDRNTAISEIDKIVEFLGSNFIYKQIVNGFPLILYCDDFKLVREVELDSYLVKFGQSYSNVSKENFESRFTIIDETEYRLCKKIEMLQKEVCELKEKLASVPNESQKIKDIYENWRKFVDPNRKWTPINPNLRYVVGDYPPYYVVDCVQTNINK